MAGLPSTVRARARCLVVAGLSGKGIEGWNEKMNVLTHPCPVRTHAHTSLYLACTVVVFETMLGTTEDFLEPGNGASDVNAMVRLQET
jgi:hypothetical protein